MKRAHTLQIRKRKMKRLVVRFKLDLVRLGNFCTYWVVFPLWYDTLVIALTPQEGQSTGAAFRESEVIGMAVV